jgi:beta-lactamase class A
VSVTLNVDQAPSSRAAPSVSAATVAPFSGGIQSYLGTRAGNKSVAVFDATTGANYSVAPQSSFVTASIVKVDILATLLRLAQDAHRGLTSQEQATATRMIEFSDNSAATTLWNEVGGGVGVARFNRLVGMPSTVPGSGGLWGLTRTTAPDQVQLLRVAAYHNAVLGDPQRLYLQTLMQQVTSSQRWGVSGGVPSGVNVAIKNGWLPVGGGWQINSIGHIFGNAKDYVIAVLTSGNPSMGYGITTVQGVSALVWSGLTPDLAGPSAVVSANGEEFVFWMGPDHNLWQAIWNGSAWGGPYNQGMGPLGSEPAATVDEKGNTAVFWKGGDGNLWAAAWTGSAWSGPTNLGMGPLGSPPTAARASNGETFVFWKGSEGSLWEAIWNGSAWSGPFNEGMGPLGSQPSVGADATGATSVFWEGGDGNLWEGHWTGSAWSGPNKLGMGPLGSAPAAAVATNGEKFVFWKGTNGSLLQAIWNGSAWSGPFAQGIGPLGSAPTAGVDSKTATYVWWRGSNNSLWEAFWTGTQWAGPVDLGIGPLG